MEIRGYQRKGPGELLLPAVDDVGLVRVDESHAAGAEPHQPGHVPQLGVAQGDPATQGMVARDYYHLLFTRLLGGLCPPKVQSIKGSFLPNLRGVWLKSTYRNQKLSLTLLTARNKILIFYRDTVIYKKHSSIT